MFPSTTSCPSVRIHGEDRAGVERLLRYCACPPFALERLYAPGDIVSLTSRGTDEYAPVPLTSSHPPPSR